VCVDRQDGTATHVITFVYDPGDPLPGVVAPVIPGFP
jgi:hypothetical protein